MIGKKTGLVLLNDWNGSIEVCFFNGPHTVSTLLANFERNDRETLRGLNEKMEFMTAR